MKKVLNFLSTRGTYLMMSGFIITLSGVIMMLIARQNVWGEHTENISMAIAITGFVVYLCGRIFIIQQRKKSKSSSTSLSSKE